VDIEALAGTVSGWQHTCGSSDHLGQATEELAKEIGKALREQGPHLIEMVI
jgi:hypothetical protein